MSVVNKVQSKQKLFIVRIHCAVFLLKRWFRVYKLKLNNAKTQVILVFLKRIISEGLLKPVRLLGFWLDLRHDGNCHVSGLHKIVDGHPYFKEFCPGYPC